MSLETIDQPNQDELAIEALEATDLNGQENNLPQESIEPLPAPIIYVVEEQPGKSALKPKPLTSVLHARHTLRFITIEDIDALATMPTTDVNGANEHHIYIIDAIKKADSYRISNEIRSIRKVNPIATIFFIGDLPAQEAYELIGVTGADRHLPATELYATVLLAQIDAANRLYYRYLKREQETVVNFGDFCLNLTHDTLYKNGVPIKLTRSEQLVLKVLALNMNVPVTKEDLDNYLSIVNNNRASVSDLKLLTKSETNRLQVCVRRLRTKLGEDEEGTLKHLISIWEKGYALFETPQETARIHVNKRRENRY